MLLRTALLCSAITLGACAINPQSEQITVTGTLMESRGKFYLQGKNTRYHLNWMPQLHYRNYVGRELTVRGSIPQQCAHAWQDAIVSVHGGAELVDWSRVDWSVCIAAEQVFLTTSDGKRLVYDWHKINMRDYYF